MSDKNGENLYINGAGIPSMQKADTSELSKGMKVVPLQPAPSNEQRGASVPTLQPASTNNPQTSTPTSNQTSSPTPATSTGQSTSNSSD